MKEISFFFRLLRSWYHCSVGQDKWCMGLSHIASRFILFIHRLNGHFCCNFYTLLANRPL